MAANPIGTETVVATVEMEEPGLAWLPGYSHSEESSSEPELSPTVAPWADLDG